MQLYASGIDESSRGATDSLLSVFNVESIQPKIDGLASHPETTVSLSTERRRSVSRR